MYPSPKIRISGYKSSKPLVLPEICLMSFLIRASDVDLSAIEVTITHMAQ